jgi:hypothetical protein
MKTERFEKYYRAESIHKKRQLAWPLYGAGLENLGIDENRSNAKSLRIRMMNY